MATAAGGGERTAWGVPEQTDEAAAQERRMFLFGKTVPAWDHARARLRPNSLRRSLRIPTFGTQHFRKRCEWRDQ